MVNKTELVFFNKRIYLLSKIVNMTLIILYYINQVKEKVLSYLPDIQYYINSHSRIENSKMGISNSMIKIFLNEFIVSIEDAHQEIYFEKDNGLLVFK